MTLVDVKIHKGGSIITKLFKFKRQALKTWDNLTNTIAVRNVLNLFRLI